jgi:type IX secretion system PorP/SprF family membrane protein
MKTLKKVTIALALFLGSLSISAQQDPMFTHYMYNTLSVNPAYAGSREALTVTALHRSQWVGFKGAPLTQTITMHAPLNNERVGLGMSILNDKIGPTNNTTLVVDYAFIMRLTEGSKLALGLSAGASLFQADLASVSLDEQDDPTYRNDINNRIAPNFGFGAYYSRDRFYAGVSVPYLIENKYSSKQQLSGSTLVGKEKRHYFFIAGAVVFLTDNLAFKPTTLVKFTEAAPIQADFTASFIIMQKLLVGAMIRTGDAVGLLVGLDITDQLHMGYSFDWSYGLQTGRYNQGSHEIMLRYDFIFSSKRQIHSPRYF